MSSPLDAETHVIPLGKNAPVQPIHTLAELSLLMISDRVGDALPGLLTTTHVTETKPNETIDQLWPEQRSFGPIQIRGHKGTGLYIFDTHSKTITGSPVRDVLDAAQDTSGNTFVFVYGNVLGGDQNDDRYAWISTKDGSVLSGTINDEPVRSLPKGLVALTA